MVSIPPSVVSLPPSGTHLALTPSQPPPPPSPCWEWGQCRYAQQQLQQCWGPCASLHRLAPQQQQLQLQQQQWQKQQPQQLEQPSVVPADSPLAGQALKLFSECVRAG